MSSKYTYMKYETPTLANIVADCESEQLRNLGTSSEFGTGCDRVSECVIDKGKEGSSRRLHLLLGQ